MGLFQKALEIIKTTTITHEGASLKQQEESKLKSGALGLLKRIQAQFLQVKPSEKQIIPEGIFYQDEEDTLVDLDALDELLEDEDLGEGQTTQNEEIVSPISKEEVDTIQDFIEDTQVSESEDFIGSTEKIEIGTGEELFEEELEPQEVIDLDEEADIIPTKTDELQEWEESAKKDLNDESLESSLLEEISKQNEFQDTLQQIQNQLTETTKELQDRESKSNAELESLQKKLENYLVLLEITKDLVKSTDFEDFFENLLYSIEGQLGPESIVIFSRRNKESDFFQPYVYDGVEMEPDFKIYQSEPIYNIIRNLDYPKFAKSISVEGLPEKDWSILQNPFTEVVTPIQSDGFLIGFIITGKLISEENYTDEDLEFLKLTSEIAGNFILKLWDISEIKEEVDHLHSSIKSHESISALVEALYDCNNFDSLFDELNDRMQRDFGILKMTLLILSQQEEYIIFNSNFFSIDTISKFVIKKDSKIVSLISQVTGMYKIENFEAYTELTSQISKDELQNMKEFSLFPLIHLGRLFGILVVHEIELEEWKADLKQTIIQVSNLIAPIVANLILQTKTEVFSKNPFNPVQDAIERELEKAKELNQKFTLVVLKVLSVTRILNLLGLDFFRDYMSFLTAKLQNQIQGEDWISRIGEGKFAIFLSGRDKFQAEEFFSNLKQELIKFPNPPRDFKLSIQLYSLTFPDQTQSKRKFIELIEDT